MMEFLYYYLGAATLIGLLIMYQDKGYAKIHHRRVPEKTLLLIAVFGGTFGIWGGMYIFHHKTRKPKFYIGVPAIFVAQVVLAYGLLRYAGIF